VTSISAHIPVENVLCPVCGCNGYITAAEGPDYDNHCCGDQLFRMVECNCCDTCYLNPRPTVEMLSVIYAPDTYYAYSFTERGNSWVVQARRRRDHQKAKAIVERMQKTLEEVRVLDIGAGDGAFLEAFRAAGIPTQNLYGLDIESNAVEKLRGKGFQGLHGRVEEANIPGEHFDLVTMIQVLEHLANPKDVVQSVRQVLRPGGLFLLETPNAASWDRRFFSRKTWGGYHFPRHWTLWTPSTIRAMLGNEGFEVLRIDTPAAAALWTWSINHVLQERRWPRAFTDFFSLNNPFALAIFWLVDLVPSLMGRSANMRVLARKPLS
jgi:2-polyprenyl-3-methyl-5-hydroxy-6-metoxy-1,4-benzoquinol methylase